MNRLTTMQIIPKTGQTQPWSILTPIRHPCGLKLSLAGFAWHSTDGHCSLRLFLPTVYLGKLLTTNKYFTIFMNLKIPNKSK